MATLRPSTQSSARNTVAVPPAPSRPRTRKRSASRTPRRISVVTAIGAPLPARPRRDTWQATHDLAELARSDSLVGKLRRAALEREDLRVQDAAVADLDRPGEGRARLPSLEPGHQRRQVRKQRPADLPGRGIPEQRRAVVDAVVEAPATDVEDRIGERGRP